MSPDPKLVDAACALAADLGRNAASKRGSQKLTTQFSKIISDPASLRFITVLADEVMRIKDPRIALRRYAELVSDTGVPGFAGPVDRLQMRLAHIVGGVAPGFTMSRMRSRIRRELATVILDAEPIALSAHLESRSHDQIASNVNLLGEAVVGNRQADKRSSDVISLLNRPDVNYVSVKLSALVANVSSYSAQRSVNEFQTRLRSVLEAATATTPAVTVNLDMEDYAELLPTAEAFVRTLSEPSFKDLTASIAIQAYLPDALGVVRSIAKWARDRRDAGGATVKIRLVKGANLAMETVDAEQHGWNAAPYPSKAAVDANYKRVLAFLLDPSLAGAIRVGIASHNLFDIAWGITLAEDRGQSERVELEMLEGMANSTAEAVAERFGSVLLYAPAVQPEHFDSAIAYLVRRLDENTHAGNFLADMFTMSVGDAAWKSQEQRFRTAVYDENTPSLEPRRNQDRTASHDSSSNNESSNDLDASEVAETTQNEFRNCSDTDWAVVRNRKWIAKELSRSLDSDARPDGPPPRPANLEESLNSTVQRGSDAARLWLAKPTGERAAILNAVADNFEEHRGQLISTMTIECSKVVPEGDGEVSEAIDFARYYADSAEQMNTVIPQSESPRGTGIRFAPYSLVVVAPPWNFPVAIAAGGVLAALAAGSAVILKPSRSATNCGHLLAELMWDAGVPNEVLQVISGLDHAAGKDLITHPLVDAVILTGSSETASKFLEWRPDLRLHAETSGKNAIVVTDSADLDQAVIDIVRSAFGHGGQKCSAASLAILTDGVYDDSRFMAQLADAVESLHLGPAAAPSTDLAPLTTNPPEKLLRAFSKLEEGEEWLVEPKMESEDPRRVSPGVRLGVKPHSFLHTTECFGPVLGIMRAPDLVTAIDWQNSTGFGLTGGIQSLDVKEIAYWCDHVEVGNAYVNRGITGAIVQRQPFGGWKASSVGPTTKTGGPNQVLSLGRWSNKVSGGDTADDELTDEDVRSAAKSYKRWWTEEFLPVQDFAGLESEANYFRYLSMPAVVARLGSATTANEVRLLIGASRTTGTPLEVSSEVDRRTLDSRLPPDIAWVKETEEEFATRIAELNPAKVRVLGELGVDARRELNSAGVNVDDSEVVTNGRIELLRWLREQAVSITAHRHGIPAPEFRDVLL